MNLGVKKDRNLRIVNMHVEDRLTLKDIGDRFGISRERARQIARQAGVPEDVTRRVQREAQMAERVTVECEECGHVESVAPSKAGRKYCSIECCGRSKEIDRRFLIGHLRGLASRLGRTPSNRDITDADGPATRTYQRHFGSLCAAQEAAGLEPNESFRGMDVEDAEHDAMVALRQGGANVLEISRQFGRAWMTVRRHLDSAGVP